MKNKITILALIFLLFVLSACRPKPSTSNENLIAIAVGKTLAAQPGPTIQPTYTPYPTLTSHAPTLEGLFCEYQFCIGHPVEIALFDAREAENPSLYSEGSLVAYSPDTFTLLVWQLNHGSDDPQFMLDLVMKDGLGSRLGNLDVNLVGDLTFFYVPTSTASAVLPVGGAAAWICGDRAFGWMAYAPNKEIAYSLFEEAASKFRCNQ
ncbi:MAG: hypothetical protein ISR59_05765 [Anaerolineales bacterium]|uniref:Lipoprotein n=1 Tax=Candidatus Desulfolinea nitratireducens TaxID=2841698 RepID=A0A8J6NM44_9CHLR|nr:hypothetical protein [Candidatus Desulfolinea nitratireducens]MBL6960596.1 hypothetical protein [Anaerolineales bacterium]